MTLSLIPLSLCINSVVDLARSESCWRLWDSSVCNKKKMFKQTKHVQNRLKLENDKSNIRSYQGSSIVELMENLVTQFFFSGFQSRFVV